MTCPNCHERCVLWFSIRVAGSICGFIAGMVVIALSVTAMIFSDYINTVAAFASVIIAVLVWTIVKTFVSYKYCALVKPVLPV